MTAENVSCFDLTWPCWPPRLILRYLWISGFEFLVWFGLGFPHDNRYLRSARNIVIVANTQRELGRDKIPARLWQIISLHDFNGPFKTLFHVDLKHSSFWPLANFKPMLNGLVHAMPWQCIFAFSLSLNVYTMIFTARKDYSQYSWIPCLS